MCCALALLFYFGVFYGTAIKCYLDQVCFRKLYAIKVFLCYHSIYLLV